MLAAAAVAKGMETNTDVIKWDEIQQEYKKNITTQHDNHRKGKHTLIYKINNNVHIIIYNIITQ